MQTRIGKPQAWELVMVNALLFATFTVCSLALAGVLAHAFTGVVIAGL
jgi:hypothetical protein